jgi:hypothetical protein
MPTIYDLELPIGPQKTYGPAMEQSATRKEDDAGQPFTAAELERTWLAHKAAILSEIAALLHETAHASA